jgi:hypothetical protein
LLNSEFFSTRHIFKHWLPPARNWSGVAIQSGSDCALLFSFVGNAALSFPGYKFVVFRNPSGSLFAA